MAEYIEREKARDAIEDADSYYTYVIDRLPSADVAPVIHGHWIGTEYDGYADGNPVYTLFECSECGVEYEQEEHYCPWCGAKMDG